MKKYLLCLLFFTLLPCWACARRSSPKDAYADSVMHLIFRYAQTVDTTGRAAHTSCAYTKFQLRTNRRNALLMLVPTMYAVAHGGGRKFISEYYNRMSHDANGQLINKRILGISTIPHRSRTMEQALRYMTPNVYEENLFQENILSPLAWLRFTLIQESGIRRRYLPGRLLTARPEKSVWLILKVNMI